MLKDNSAASAAIKHKAEQSGAERQVVEAAADLLKDQGRLPADFALPARGVAGKAKP